MGRRVVNSAEANFRAGYMLFARQHRRSFVRRVRARCEVRYLAMWHLGEPALAALGNGKNTRLWGKR